MLENTAKSHLLPQQSSKLLDVVTKDQGTYIINAESPYGNSVAEHINDFRFDIVDLNSEANTNSKRQANVVFRFFWFRPAQDNVHCWVVQAAIVTTHDIKAGSEILTDYGRDFWEAKKELALQQEHQQLQQNKMKEKICCLQSGVPVKVSRRPPASACAVCRKRRHKDDDLCRCNCSLCNLDDTLCRCKCSVCQNPMQWFWVEFRASGRATGCWAPLCAITANPTAQKLLHKHI